MRAADIDPWVGLRHDADAFDCADLVMLVQRELFGRELRLPSPRPRGTAGSAALPDLSRAYGTRTDNPRDGDGVLMLESGQKRAGHCGVWFWLAHEAWVLHATEKTGCSVLHRVRELPDYGLRVEGYYAWAQ